MNKKIVFFDIDGTLVDEDKNIPSTTKQAIEELQRNDVFVAIATGRPPFMYQDLREELNVDTFISFNGQHVVFEGETIYENPIDGEKINHLYKDSQKGNYPMVFMSDTKMRSTELDHIHIEESLNKLKFGYPKLDRSFHLEETIYQALLFCETDEEKFLKDNHEDFYFLRWHPFACDILPNDGSKAVGMNKVLEASGIHLDNSFAFGDGINDLELLQAIGTGIAMGNSVPQLKSVADYVTDHVSNEGIVKGLEYYNLV